MMVLLLCYGTGKTPEACFEHIEKLRPIAYIDPSYMAACRRIFAGMTEWLGWPLGEVKWEEDWKDECDAWLEQV